MRKNRDDLPFIIGREFKTPEDATGEHTISIDRLKKDKSLLVKECRIREKSLGFDADPPTLNSYSENKFREHYKKNLDQLKTYLAPYLPDIMLVYAKNKDGDGVGYMVSPEIIQTKKLSDAEKSSREEEYDNLLVGIIRMWRENDSRVVDFKQIGNIHYGHTKKDETNRLYIVDIYPFVVYNKDDFKMEMRSLMEEHLECEFTNSKVALDELDNLDSD